MPVHYGGFCKLDPNPYQDQSQDPGHSQHKKHCSSHNMLKQNILCAQNITRHRARKEKEKAPNTSKL